MNLYLDELEQTGQEWGIAAYPRKDGEQKQGLWPGDGEEWKHYTCWIGPPSDRYSGQSIINFQEAISMAVFNYTMKYRW